VATWRWKKDLRISLLILTQYSLLSFKVILVVQEWVASWQYPQCAQILLLQTLVRSCGEDVVLCNACLCLPGTVQLETPIDVFKLSTRNRQLQLHSGVVSYDVIAESNQFNLRSSVDFSQTDRSLHLKFYNTPGQLYIVACIHCTSYFCSV